MEVGVEGAEEGAEEAMGEGPGEELEARRREVQRAGAPSAPVDGPSGPSGDLPSCRPSKMLEPGAVGSGRIGRSVGRAFG
eukprot:6720126-Pyramimonas_sp.AAC.1